VHFLLFQVLIVFVLFRFFFEIFFLHEKGYVATSDLAEGFNGIDYALLVGARPRTKGKEFQD